MSIQRTRATIPTTVVTFLFLITTMTAMTVMESNYSVDGFVTNTGAGVRPARTTTSTTKLFMAAVLKPAAIPLLDSGKAVARSGELLIDLTTDMDIYGGGLSATGALMRNAGDAIAQAAASCRFKTGLELVCDELREAGTCFKEGSDKIKSAIDEAKVDENEQLVAALETMVPTIQSAGISLEAVGECIIKQSTVNEIGQNIVDCGTTLNKLSDQILILSKPYYNNADDDKNDTTNNINGGGGDANPGNGILSSQRLKFGAERMIVAGNELTGTKPPTKKKGKSWLKG